VVDRSVASTSAKKAWQASHLIIVGWEMTGRGEGFDKFAFSPPYIKTNCSETTPEIIFGILQCSRIILAVALHMAIGILHWIPFFCSKNPSIFEGFIVFVLSFLPSVHIFWAFYWHSHQDHQKNGTGYWYLLDLIVYEQYL
jgi:hypothetical protein